MTTVSLANPSQTQHPSAVNTYQYRFTAKCPVNEQDISYHLTIRTWDMIMVERLKGFCAQIVMAYHEDLADALKAEFGGKQILDAEHHGVRIKTKR